MANRTNQIPPETMEEVISSIHRACELARNLESNLPNLANQPDMLSVSIDQIVKTFSAARERILISQQDPTSASSFAPMLPREAVKQETQQPQMGATSMQELLRSSYAETMDQFFQMQQLQAARSTAPYDVGALLGRVDFPQLRSRDTLQIGEMGGRDTMEGSERSKGPEREVQAIEASPSRPRRSSRKKDDLEKRTVMVPAPEFGNTEMPQEDGFTWRKYGQKEILGCKYPRSYYRCTHQKLYECPAKKQVQRLDHNPSIFEVTYRGKHTCHMSSTAPSSVPLPQLLVDISQDMNQGAISSCQTQLSLSSTSISGWPSSMNLSLRSGRGMAPAAAADATSGSAGPSTSRFGTDFPVVDMADAMFNSGSSSGNSMESLFAPTPAEDKWEPSEKKN